MDGASGQARESAVAYARRRPERSVLGLWLEQNEGAKFWLKVVNELKTRGVRDILITCCDGLKGFPEAIETAFPATVVQTCIVHMIRNSLRFVSYKDRKAVAKDLRPVYTAASREEALAALEVFEGKWTRRYPMIGASWRDNWERVVPFLDFPPDVRRVIYTTNAIESLNSSLRKLLHYRGHFPSDEALFNLLYLSLTKHGEEVGEVAPRLEQRPRPVLDIFQRQDSGVTLINSAHRD